MRALNPVDGILIRRPGEDPDTQGEGGHVEAVQQGGPGAKGRQQRQEGQNQGRTLPGVSQQHSFADALMSDFWPPEL